MATLEDVYGKLITIDGSLSDIAKGMLGKVKGGEDNPDTKQYRKNLGTLSDKFKKFIDGKDFDVMKDLTKAMKEFTKETKEQRTMRKAATGGIAGAAASGGLDMKKAAEGAKAMSEDMESIEKASKEIGENMENWYDKNEAKQVEAAFANVGRSIKSQSNALKLSWGSWKNVVSTLREKNRELSKGEKLTAEEVYDVSEAISRSKELWMWQRRKIRGLADEIDQLVKLNKLDEARVKFRKLAAVSEGYAEGARNRSTAMGVAGEIKGNVGTVARGVGNLLSSQTGFDKVSPKALEVAGAKEYADYLKEIGNRLYEIKGITGDVKTDFHTMGEDALKLYMTTGQESKIVRTQLVKNLTRGISEQKTLNDVTKRGLQTATLIGSNAEGTAEEFADWHLRLKLGDTDLDHIRANLQAVAKTTGITGDNLLDAFKATKDLAQQMKWAGTYSNDMQRNLTQTLAIAKQLGVEGQVKSTLSALGSAVGFQKADAKKKSFLLQAAQAAGLNPMDVVLGNINTPEQRAALAKGMETVRNRFKEGGMGDLQFYNAFGYESLGEAKAEGEAHTRGAVGGNKPAVGEGSAEALIRQKKEETGTANAVQDALNQIAEKWKNVGSNAVDLLLQANKDVIAKGLELAGTIEDLIDVFGQLKDVVMALIPLFGMGALGLGGAIGPFLGAAGIFAVLAIGGWALYKTWNDVQNMLKKTGEGMGKINQSVEKRMVENYRIEKLEKYSREDIRGLQGNIAENERNLPFLQEQAKEHMYAMPGLRKAAGGMKISDKFSELSGSIEGRKQLMDMASKMQESPEKETIKGYLVKLEEIERQKLALDTANKLQDANTPAGKAAIIKAYNENPMIAADRQKQKEMAQAFEDLKAMSPKERQRVYNTTTPGSDWQRDVGEMLKKIEKDEATKAAADNAIIALAEAGEKEGSIFTHDTHLEDILEEMAIPLAKIAPDLGGTTQFDRQRMYGFDDDTPVSKAMEETTVSMDKVEQNTAEANRHLSSMVDQLEQIINIFAGGSNTIGGGDTTSDWKPKSPANYWSTSMAAMTGSPLLGGTGNPAL
jgi:hypothetical protein